MIPGGDQLHLDTLERIREAAARRDDSKVTLTPEGQVSLGVDY